MISDILFLPGADLTLRMIKSDFRKQEQGKDINQIGFFEMNAKPQKG